MEAHLTPAWAVIPFAAYLLTIAVLPIFAGRLWERDRIKLAVAALAAAPVVAFLLSRPEGGHLLAHAVGEYAAFIALLAALFTISGGISVRGALAGTPLANTALLAVGASLASVIGTTGASVLLIRPLLRANERRAFATHVVVFFIFVVSNAGGLLTPLGDPPLFLGFLRGVPFAWTFRLLPQWLAVNGALLAAFAVVDVIVLRRSGRAAEGVGEGAVEVGPLRIEGKLNVLWLLATVLVVLLVGAYGTRLFGDGYTRTGVQVVSFLACAVLSFKTTSPRVHEANRFSWAPIVEVAIVFAGVFLTMVPALSFLAERGATLGVTKPVHFFWATGVLSSVLDNAPTYLTFAALAAGVVGVPPDDLGALSAHPSGSDLLTAISCGAVFMGALTYIGNGPNLMVKAIAERHGVRMPSFFGYLAWSLAILLPLFAIVSRIFF